MSNIIESLEQLTALYGEPKPTSLAKEVPELNAVYKQWLSQTCFFALASSGSSGLDCTPRGDAQGQAFKVLNDKTLLIPDRRGNNRLDTLRNIIEDPRVGLLFLIPGITEALRINGKAVISTAEEHVSEFDFNGKLPVSCIVVSIEAVYFQCARAILRSGLWLESAKKTKDTVPTAGQMVQGVQPDFDGKNYDETLVSRLKNELY